MKKDLLLVIDMQNVYGEDGAWCCPGAAAAAERIKKLICERAGSLDVIFTRFLSDDGAQGTWKEYNRVNSEINADPHANGMMDIFSDEIRKYPLYSKSLYSSFAIPEVREAARRAERVLLTGVVAECCVLFTAVSLIDEGIPVLYMKDCVAGIDSETEKAAETVLGGLEPVQVRIMSSEEYLSETENDQR
ncbi:MAG: cysteine hydrolase [Lachnospiraceae bacterium]|nr:cysteine hydrolase [Lachnospiraceae bacterium]